MSVLKLLEENPLFFKEINEAHPSWDKVHNNAVVHTRLRMDGDINPILDEARPHETESVKNFRVKNEKQFTRSGFDMFVSKVSKHISKCVHSTNSISTPIKEWLDTNPFKYLGESKAEKTYIREIILPKALENPNQALVAFPYNKEDSGLPPNLGDDNEIVAVAPLIIDHDTLRHVGTDSFSFCGGRVSVKNGKANISEEFYYSADKENWYLHIPYYEKDPKSQNNKREYKTILWYKHNTGENLLNFLPGDYSCSRDNKIEYLESYIRTYYSFADKAMQAFSDETVVNLRYSYPIPEIKPTKCDAQGCEEGFIGMDRKNPCKQCRGDGYVLWPGMSGALISPEESNSVLEGKTSNKPAIQWHNPEMGFAKHAYERAFDLLDKAYKSIGLRMYDAAGASSSGDALMVWREDERDRIMTVINGVYNTWDRFLWQCECLLVRNPDVRSKPKTIIPDVIDIKTANELKEEVEEALPEHKYFAHMNFITKKYENDPIMLKVHHALLSYTPYMTMSIEEMKLNMAKGICTANDLVRKQWGSIAIDHVQRELKQGLCDLSVSEIHAKMDDYLKERGLLFEASAENEDEDFTPNRLTESVTSDIKDKLNAIGIATRAGVFTPTKEDERQVRSELNLPELPEVVSDAWDEDGGTRRPITLKSGDVAEAEEAKLKEGLKETTDEKTS